MAYNSYSTAVPWRVTQPASISAHKVQGKSVDASTPSRLSFQETISHVRDMAWILTYNGEAEGAGEQMHRA